MGEGAWLVAFLVAQRLVELVLRNPTPGVCVRRRR